MRVNGFRVLLEARERDRDGDTIQNQPKDAVQVAEAIRRDKAKPGGPKSTTTQIAASAYGRGDTTNPTSGKEASLGRPDTGLPGVAGEARI